MEVLATALGNGRAVGVCSPRGGRQGAEPLHRVRSDAVPKVLDPSDVVGRGGSLTHNTGRHTHHG